MIGECAGPGGDNADLHAQQALQGSVVHGGLCREHLADEAGRLRRRDAEFRGGPLLQHTGGGVDQVGVLRVCLGRWPHRPAGRFVCGEELVVAAVIYPALQLGGTLDDPRWHDMRLFSEGEQRIEEDGDGAVIELFKLLQKDARVDAALELGGIASHLHEGPKGGVGILACEQPASVGGVLGASAPAHEQGNCRQIDGGLARMPSGESSRSADLHQKVRERAVAHMPCEHVSQLVAKDEA